MTTAASSTSALGFRPEPEWVSQTRAQLATAAAALPDSGLDVLAAAGALSAAGLSVVLPAQLDLAAAHQELGAEADLALRAVEEACAALDECCDEGADPEAGVADTVWRALSLRSRIELQREALRHSERPDGEATWAEALAAADDLLEHRAWLLGCAGARASSALARIEPGQRQRWWWLVASERHAQVGLGAMADLAEWVVTFPQAKDAWARALADASRLRALAPPLDLRQHGTESPRSEARPGGVVSIRDWLRTRAPTGTTGDVLHAAAASSTQTWVVLFKVDDIVVSHVDGTWLWLHIAADTKVEGRPTLHVPGSASEAFEPVPEDPGSFRVVLTDTMLDAVRVGIRVAHAAGLTEITLPSPPAP
jgi:hypothetical protein